MDYQKTQEDIQREENDIKTNPVMRWLVNGNKFKFNVGDIIIKKTKRYTYNPHNVEPEDRWDTEVINKTTGAPRKYIYCFENELGIGYIRQLKVDGSGVCGTLICLINFDPDNTRFELDPEYMDHMLIGEEEFQPNREYQEKKQFRQEAMAKNKEILLGTTSPKKLWAWFKDLKKGDEFWYGTDFDTFSKTKFKITKITKEKAPDLLKRDSYLYGGNGKYDSYYGQRLVKLADKDWFKIEVEVLGALDASAGYGRYYAGQKHWFDAVDFMNAKVSFKEPFPMKDELCGPQK